MNMINLTRDPVTGAPENRCVNPFRGMTAFHLFLLTAGFLRNFDYANIPEDLKQRFRRAADACDAATTLYLQEIEANTLTPDRVQPQFLRSRTALGELVEAIEDPECGGKYACLPLASVLEQIVNEINSNIGRPAFEGLPLPF